MTKIVKDKFLESFKDAIRNLREESALPLRKVAAYLDVDQAIISKFEHGTRMPTRDQVIKMADVYFKAEEKALLIKWLAAKVIYEINDDEFAVEAMKAAEEQIRYNLNPKRKSK